MEESKGRLNHAQENSKMNRTVTVLSPAEAKEVERVRDGLFA